ncbi:MAG: hypothetical protein K6G22_07980 [Lachnospiraceae bacterium]|nr:hypothetical protein [Lachnospiraceae bacterium]
MDRTTAKGKDNKGITLLEILISVCLLAIVLMPISTALMTALRINMEARTLLTATDVAQSLMEDISEKTYDECLTTVKALETANKKRAAKEIGFSAIDGDWFNEHDHVQKVAFPTGVSPVGIATTSLGNNIDLISNNKGLNAKFVEVMKGYTGAKQLIYSVDPNNLLLYMGYMGVSSKGKTYDVVISFLPVARTTTDTWYTYEVFMDVYAYGKGGTRLTGDPTVSLKTGIRARD